MANEPDKYIPLEAIEEASKLRRTAPRDHQLRIFPEPGVGIITEIFVNGVIWFASIFNPEPKSKK